MTPAFIIIVPALTGAFALAAGLVASVIHQISEAKFEAEKKSRRALDNRALAC